MTYTKSRPPVVKANLGKIASATCTIVDEAGALVVSGAMTRTPNTTIWHYLVPGTNMATTYTRYEYYITDASDNVLEEGSFEIDDQNSGLGGAIVNKDFECPSIVGVPAQVLGVKTYPVRFRPSAADGTFVSGVTEIADTGAPLISITFSSSNSAHNVTGEHMSLVNSQWEYNWEIPYGTPEDIVKVSIGCQSNGKVYTFVKTVEIVKPREFNPQRLAVGGVG